MKIESVEIKNFKAIGELGLELKGNNVYVVGGNGRGKSSFLDAIFKILHGKDLPPKLVKDGQRAGVVEINMGEYIVRATFNAKNEKVKLEVENPDGAKYPTPRTMLDTLVGTIDFDINHFFSLTPKKQVEFVKQLSGIDFSDLDAEYKKLYDERTYINRSVKEIEAKTVTYDKTKTKKVDINALVEELNKVNGFNAAIEQVENRITQRNTAIGLNEQEIQALLRRVDELQGKIDTDRSLNQQASQWLKDNPKKDVAAIQDQLATASEHNAQVERTLKAMETYKELDAAIAKQTGINAKMAEIEAAKKEAISSAKMPVPGLTFDDDQLYLNGLPFERSQINTATAIITGLQINLALLGEVKIARFDGSLLDNESLKQVEDWAKENGLQLFVELVDRSGEALKIEVRESVEMLEEVAA